MRRLPLLLVPLLLAACGGGSTTPDDDLSDLNYPRFYDGTARFTRTANAGGLNDVVSFVGNVRFETTDRGAPPVGYTMVSGSMSVVHQAEIGQGGCTLGGATNLTLGPGDGSFIIFPESRYSGTIRKQVTFISAVACQGHPLVDFPDSASIDLEIEGSTIDGRIQGTMVPITVGEFRFEGSWDFTGVR